MIVHTSAAMNKYSNTNGMVEITAQFRLSERRRLYSALLVGIKPNLPKPPLRSSLPLSLISPSFHLFGQITLTLTALLVH